MDLSRNASEKQASKKNTIQLPRQLNGSRSATRETLFEPGEDSDDAEFYDIETAEATSPYFDPARAHSYIPVDHGYRQRRLSPSQVFFRPSLFGWRHDSVLPAVVSCITLVLVALAIAAGVYRLQPRLAPTYEPNLLNATDSGDWWSVSGEKDGSNQYRILKSQVAFEARDEFQIGRRRRILESGKFKVYYSTETTFHQYLLTNPYSILTTDPSEASLFYVPLLSACEFRRTGWSGQANLTSFVSEKIAELSETFPRAAAAFGPNKVRRDHVLVFSHDRGTIYAPKNVVEGAISVVPMSAGFEGESKAFGMDSIVVPHFSPHPGLVPPIGGIEEWQFGFRDNFAFFVGKCAPADPVRQLFCDTVAALSHTRPTHFPIPPSVLRPTTAGYPSDFEIALQMRKTTFCLVPRGWTPSTTRLFDSVYEGCIPVVIGGLGNATTEIGLDWPFFDLLPGLRNAALIIDENKIEKLDEILIAVSEAKVVRRQLILFELRRWNFVYRRGIGASGGFREGCGGEEEEGADCGFGDRKHLDVKGEEGWDAFEFFLMELAGRADAIGL